MASRGNPCPAVAAGLSLGGWAACGVCFSPLLAYSVTGGEKLISIDNRGRSLRLSDPKALGPGACENCFLAAVLGARLFAGPDILMLALRFSRNLIHVFCC